jgi:predicted metalloendopeptidase
MRLRAALAAGVLVSASVVGQSPAGSGLDLTALDRTVRPQDDLFRHANGRWLATVDIPTDRVTYGTFADMAERIDADLRAIAEDAVRTPAPAGSPLRQIGDFYRSAMDEARLSALGVEPIRPQLDRLAGIRTREEFAFEAGRLTSQMAGGPFGNSIVVDANDPTRLIVEIPQGGTMLPNRDAYLNADVELRQRYETYLSRLFTLAGRGDAEAAARSVVAFETALAKVQLPAVESRLAARSAPRRTLPELAALMPGFDWAAWAKPLGFDRVASVVPLQPSFFRSFAALVAETPLETLKNWLAARHLNASAPYLSPAFVDARFEMFGRTLVGQEQPRERWRLGVSLASAYLGDAFGRLYVERHFPRKARARAERLMENLVTAYRQAIREASWLAPATKREALDKLSRLRLKIGYPTRWRDYRDLTIRDDDLMGNIVRGRAFDNKFRMTRVAGPLDNGEWMVPVQTLNAYYNPALNEITLPASVLQPPIFDATADDAANYGAVGALMGHELSHALDDRGQAYDARGVPRVWWTPPDLERFRESSFVLTQQYNAYSPLDGVHVNGTLTLTENRADVSGLALAYRAYVLSLGGKPAPVLDGFSGAQRFFLGWAAMWRVKVRESYLRQWVMSQPHAPYEYRANGPVSHLEAFYEAFAVTPQDKLFRPPEARVRFW